LADQTITKESGSAKLRRCVSAGEALPEEIGKRWEKTFGVPILDGIGSTEMLHIFLSNRPDDIRYGTTGVAVPGYDLKIVNENGQEVEQGEIGELLVSGPSSAVAYWNNRAKSLATFQGPWTRTGDKYLQTKEGYYIYAGRSDDMLKVSGIWVSPFEVESALQAHPKVLEVAVVGHADNDDLIKPKAFVVLKDGVGATDALVGELQSFVKDRLAPYKYPRWIEFVSELPKTATGKIQRFKLRAQA
jgi:benzoate-CoA ligase family protein